jgi:hypothetical protein
VAYAMGKNQKSHYILRITFESGGLIKADSHLMQFFSGHAMTYANQTAFSLSGGKPYAFFVGKLFNFDTMAGTSPRTYAAGYLMKYAMVEGEDLVTECCKSYKVEFSSSSCIAFNEQFETVSTANSRFILSTNQISFAYASSLDSNSYLSLTV